MTMKKEGVYMQMFILLSLKHTWTPSRKTNKYQAKQNSYRTMHTPPTYQALGPKSKPQNIP